jgi:serine/threonine-protein phosphatase PGAM5
MRFFARLSPLAIVGIGTFNRDWNPIWDHRVDRKVKTKHHVFLIRHGQYVSKDPSLDREAEYSPEEDFIKNDSLRPLTSLGREQAEITGNRLADILQNEGLLHSNIVRVYSSDMARAKETATIIQSALEQKVKDNLPLYVDSLLREGAPCKPNGYDGPWKPEHFEYNEEGCRIEGAFRKYIHRMEMSNEKPVRPFIEKNEVKHTVDVIVCHGNLIRYTLLRALQLPSDAWLHFGLYNASISRLAVGNDGWVGCSNIGDTGAIPPSKITYG